MRTAQYVGHHTVRVADSTPRPPGPDDVQIRVAYVGLCGTDLHVVHGDMDQRVTLPLTFGHEMSGTVETVGDHVDSIRPGDPVTVMPLIWDGTCPACRAGHQHICQNLDFIGIDSPGALQALWTVPAKVVVPVPQGMPLQHAALIEPTAVAVHDVRRAELTPGEHAVVLGGGPIGLLIATVARHFGGDVIVSEPDLRRRTQAATLGFATIDPSTQDLADEIRSWTQGVGADVVFEVSGAASAALAATGLARVRGRVVLVAIHPTPRPMNLQEVFWRELTLLGARVYQRDDFTTATELIDDLVVPVDLLISRVLPLPETQIGIELLEQGEAMKVLVEVQETPR